MASKRLLRALSQSLRSAPHVTIRTTTRCLCSIALSKRHALPLRPRSFPSHRSFSSVTSSRKEAPISYPPQEEFPSERKGTSSPSKIYTFQDISSLSSNPDPRRILIDVREPSELQSTGTIPTAKNIPISSSPDAFFLSEDEFENRYGWERPGSGSEAEVVFFCKSGVRSKMAAELAKRAEFGGKGGVGEYPGSWKDWEANGGKTEKV